MVSWCFPSIFISTGIMILCLKKVVFWPYFTNTGILTFSLSVGVVATLKFGPHPLKVGIVDHCNSGSFLSNIGILISFFHSKHWNIEVEFWFYFYKHCNSHIILPNTGILALFFIHIGCVILFFKRLRIRDSGPISVSTEIMILSLQTLQL